MEMGEDAGGTPEPFQLILRDSALTLCVCPNFRMEDIGIPRLLRDTVLRQIHVS